MVKHGQWLEGGCGRLIMVALARIQGLIEIIIPPAIRQVFPFVSHVVATVHCTQPLLHCNMLWTVCVYVPRRWRSWRYKIANKRTSLLSPKLGMSRVGRPAGRSSFNQYLPFLLILLFHLHYHGILLPRPRSLGLVGWINTAFGWLTVSCMSLLDSIDCHRVVIWYFGVLWL